MKRKHKTDDPQAWRSDAQSILCDLRICQDAIREKHDFEGISLATIHINRWRKGKIETWKYEAIPGFCVITQLIDGQVADTFNVQVNFD